MLLAWAEGTTTLVVGTGVTGPASADAGVTTAAEKPATPPNDDAASRVEAPTRRRFPLAEIPSFGENDHLGRGTLNVLNILPSCRDRCGATALTLQIT